MGRQIKIDLIDNGYVLSYVKHSALGQGPEPIVAFFKTLDEVCEHLLKLK
jgi:hypothetical protein